MIKVRNAVALVALALITPAVASAAGMTTHMWMTEEAIDLVETPELKSILKAHEDAALTGSIFPDYGGASSYRKKYKANKKALRRAHEPVFVNAYMDLLRERCAPDFSDCHELLAHFMGTAAHGYEDEVYNRLFMAKAEAIDPNPQDLDTSADLALIVDHHRFGAIPHYVTPVDEMIELYQRIGVTTSAAELMAGHRIHKAALHGERILAPIQYPKLKKDIPWTVANIRDHQGGVMQTASVIAQYWEALWAMLNGEPAKLVIASYPMPGDAITPDDFISVFFSRQIDPRTVTENSFALIGPDGQPVAGAVETYRYHVSSFIPAAPLPEGEYSFTLTTEAKDLKGAGPTRDLASKFFVRRLLN